MHNLTQSQFQAAVELGAIQSVAIEPAGACFSVKLVTIKGEATLVQSRKSEPRLFGTADSALRLLRKMGVKRIVLDHLERWQPEETSLTRRTRPDRAAALTRAAQYDRWIQAKVEASRDDPRPAITDDEWQRILASKRATAGQPTGTSQA
jgi:hypothetical protein